jgi:exopolyphosphatase/guanosine-5'-triphosphate,3'-diphosphate pyrophosphatase
LDFSPQPAGELRGRDLEAVRKQLGREPSVPFTVVARCAPDGHPLVIRNHPLAADGSPFPTRYWLTCPEATRSVSQLESDGAIGDLNRRIEDDPAFADAVARAHDEAARDRASAVRGAGSWGGVGGTRTGVKCLHAHYANYLAGGDDPGGGWTPAQVEPIHGPVCADRAAAIDQGTNSIRLLISEPRLDGSLLEIARDLVITRLGEGVDETGRLAPEALSRTKEALALYCRRARALRALRIRVAATSAVREAGNGEELALAVREHAGVPLEVITGTEEARLSFVGATRGLDAPRPFCVFDIGGGSTEFVVGSEKPEHAVSLQLGSVRLTERFVRSDPPAAEERAAIRSEIAARLDEVAGAVPVRNAATVVAVAGTATTVQAMALGLPRYDPDRIHRTELTLKAAVRVLEDLAAMTNAERAALPFMAPGRGDVIVAGAEILVAVMERFGFGRILVSEEDILDGLAVELIMRQ